jgi:pyruvate,water dikinase
MSETRTPIVPPENFPVEWPDPSYEAQFWTWDQMHQPHPLTPLTATYEVPAFAEGSSRGFRALRMPMELHTCVVNTYAYQSIQFTAETTGFPPPWWGDVEQEFASRLPGLHKAWQDTWLPEVTSINDRLRTFDYAHAPDAGLLAFIDEAHEMRKRAWDTHMQVVMPVMGAASRFAETYEQFLGKPDGHEPYLLLQGFENMSMESGKALWRVSRRALADPDVARTIAETPRERIAVELQRSEAGRAFWIQFEAYLHEYGWRSDAFELADPAWAEEPAIPLAALRDYLTAPDEADPAVQEQRCREEREELTRDCLERLDGHEGRPLFELLLGIAQQYLPVQEDHNFYIDQMNTVLLRLPLLEAGHRLAEAGAIGDRDDVFYLRYDELAPALTEPASRDWASLVSERRAERERWAAVVPPRELGTPLPEGVARNPVSGSFFGTAPERSKDPKVINGTGASAGVVTAPARVVRVLTEAYKLQPGDVLVCEMTMPAWTPLFATVSAVVADSGGILSHCAIVAREYRIPCVVGTHIGTQVLKDGQRITVDGAQGIVRIEGRRRSRSKP